VRNRYVYRAAIPAIVGVIAITGCGSNKSSGGGAGSGSGGKTVVIGMSAPLTGSLSELGLGMKNSVQLAVNQANASKKVSGWTIKFQPEDDQADANTGGQVASRLASESNVVAVVGTLNSSVAQQEQQTYNDANIVMISPANTNPTLTQGPNYAKGQKTRPYKTYFRVATTDAIQGPFAADYTYNTLHKKSVATVNDKLTYGQGLVQEFEQRFKSDGGKIVDHQTVTDGQKDYSALVSELKNKHPDMVYFGGQYPEASLLSKQMKSSGLKIPLMGGDGLYADDYIKVAKQQGEGDLASSVGAPTAALASASAFVTAYKNAKFSSDFSAYGAYAYDCANVIIDALAKVLPGKSSIDDSVKQAIVAAVQSANTNGATGKISFDQYGDTTNKVLTMYVIKNQKWTPAKTEAFNG